MAETMEERTEMATPQELPEGELKWLSLDQLCESEWNPRQFYPQQEMDELVESMRSSGYREWLPLMVRPIPNRDNDPLYEIGAGHRRSRAARLAGITTVPCIIRELTDEQFLEVLNFDNSGRAGVHPLHEAAGWKQYMERTGKGVLDIAARLGQSKEYVYQRLKYADLIPEAKRAFLNGTIAGGHAILIARLQPDDQERALHFTVATASVHTPSVRDLAGFIQRDIHLTLSNTCFDLLSADLVPAAGSCALCPKRTRNAMELMLPVEQASDAGQPRDECMDPSCFAGKVDAHLVQIQRLFEEKEEGKPLLRISHSLIARRGADYGRGNFERLSADPAPGLEPGVWMDGPSVGRMVYVQFFVPKADDASLGEQQAEADKRADEARAARKLEAERTLMRQREREAADRREEEARHQREDQKRREKAQREKAVRRAILEAISSKVGGLSRVDVEVLLCDYDYLTNADMNDEFAERFPSLDGSMSKNDAEKALGKFSDGEIFQLAVLLPLFDDLDDFRLDEAPDALLAAAKRYKVDAGKIRKELEKPPAPPKEAQKKIAVPKPTAKKAKPSVAKKKAAVAKKAKGAKVK